MGLIKRMIWRRKHKECEVSIETSEDNEDGSCKTRDELLKKGLV